MLRDPALAPAGKTGVIVSTLMDYRLVKAIAEAGWYPAFKALCEEQMGANGLGLPARRGKNKSANPYQIGLYGPVILISQADYQAVGGHAAIRDSIVFYPPLLLFYLLIFLRSLAKKILGRPVIWKDREIRLDK